MSDNRRSATTDIQLDWDVWKAELEAVTLARAPGAYGPEGVIAATGPECWREMYDNGFTAEDAFEEDRFYWDD